MGLMACERMPKEDYITVSGGGKIYYEEYGKGTPLILLHGHSLDTRMWDEQFYDFAQGHRTIRLDFRGYGRSSEQREEFQHTHVDDVLTVMDSLKIEKAHISVSPWEPSWRAICWQCTPKGCSVARW